MGRRKRTRLDVEGRRRNLGQLVRLGAEVRTARRRRQLTQARLGLRAGVGRMTVSRLERGLGGGLSMDAWQRVGLAVGRPVVVALQRDLDGETADAGHLAIQELVLRLGRAAGCAGRLELATRSTDPWRSADVGLLDDAQRRLILVKCWNTLGDIGAACRATERKRAEAALLAAAHWGTTACPVASVWVVRATVRNRTIVARYPEVFAARFPAGSLAWAAALREARPPPPTPSLVWVRPGRQQDLRDAATVTTAVSCPRARHGGHGPRRLQNLRDPATMRAWTTLTTSR